MPFLIFDRDHLRSNMGIISCSGSFAVQFGNHLRSGIIYDTIWGSFEVLGSFAVQLRDHLRACKHTLYSQEFIVKKTRDEIKKKRQLIDCIDLPPKSPNHHIRNEYQSRRRIFMIAEFSSSERINISLSYARDH